MVQPRWLREHRRAARAVVAHALAAEVAEEVLARTRPDRELTLAEILRQQGVRPFNWEEYRSRDTGLTSEDWAELRAAMQRGRER